MNKREELTKKLEAAMLYTSACAKECDELEEELRFAIDDYEKADKIVDDLLEELKGLL